jgi:acetylornithine deacetylase/succinyl-diaminopimelate desuccinylase-like protein
MSSSPTDSLSSDLVDETIRICRELIQIPSVNYGDGQGDEKEVANHVVKLLDEVGIKSRIYESAPGRCNVIARIKGSDSNLPGLVVHGHLDVVPANASDWSVDPFKAEIIDGYIWGRGAVDMKNMNAMIIATVRDWKRTGFVAKRDIVLAFFADEEAGSIFGSHFMVDKHPEVFAGCTEAISEVGGFSVTLGNGKRLYLIETAEKGIHWMRLTAHGRAGHGSLMNQENAVSRISEAVAKIGSHQWPQRYSATVKTFFKRIAHVTGKTYDETDLRPLLSELGFASRMIGATLQNTANPTMLEAGYKANVIPGSASATIDGRFIPGYEDELNETIKMLVGPEIVIETITRDKALEVSFETDLVEQMCLSLIKHDPDAIPVPYVMSGGTDNKALADLGIIGYGFSPLKLPADFDFMAMFHGVDERVPIEGLAFGVHVLKDFLERS